MILPKHLNIGEYTKLPEEPPDNDKILKAILAGGTAATIGLSGVLDDIKQWFQSLGATEGENKLSNDILYEFNNGDRNLQLKKVPVTGSKYYVRFYLNNDPYTFIRRNSASTGTDFWENDNYDFVYRELDEINSYGVKPKRVIDVYYEDTFVYRNDIDGTIGPIEDNFELKESSNINYNITNNSTVINNIPPTTIPQPDIGTLPNIQEIITPEGDKKIMYPGTMDDLVTDLNNNTTLEDLIGSLNNHQSGNFTSYTLTETEQGVEIDYGTITDTPYPDINIEPIEDTSQFQGENIGLLKSIVNWLSNIKNEIVNIGDKIDNQVEEEIEEEEPKEIDFSPITSVSLTDKFPFSLPWDLRDSISLLASEGEAPVWEIPIVTEIITIDMGEFEGLASIARVFNTLLFIIALIILTRRFI